MITQYVAFYSNTIPALPDGICGTRQQNICSQHFGTTVAKAAKEFHISRLETFLGTDPESPAPGSVKSACKVTSALGKAQNSPHCPGEIRSPL